MIDTDTSEGFRFLAKAMNVSEYREATQKIIEGLVAKVGEDKVALNYEVLEINETKKVSIKLNLPITKKF